MLMLVANPWIEGSPEPETSHELAGSPVLAFSQRTGFAATAQPVRLCECSTTSETPPAPSARIKPTEAIRKRTRVLEGCFVVIEDQPVADTNCYVEDLCRFSNRRATG